MRIHDTVGEARALGFRACKRCKPDGLIEESERELPLRELAEAVELSPAHFHRIFKAAIGMTPKRYASGLRAGRIRAALLEAAL